MNRGILHLFSVYVCTFTVSGVIVKHIGSDICEGINEDCRVCNREIASFCWKGCEKKKNVEIVRIYFSLLCTTVTMPFSAKMKDFSHSSVIIFWCFCCFFVSVIAGVENDCGCDSDRCEAFADNGKALYVNKRNGCNAVD